MRAAKKLQKELKRRYGKMAENMEPYYHHLDLRLLSEMDDDAFAYIIQNLRGVNMLDLNETEVTDESIALITRLEYVKELRMKGCHQITNGCLPHINQLSQLEFLHLNHTQVTIDGLLQLRGLRMLETLLFSDNEPDTLDQNWSNCNRSCPIVRWLSIPGHGLQ